MRQSFRLPRRLTCSGSVGDTRGRDRKRQGSIHILTLPAKGIPQSIEEIPPAIVRPTQSIAGPVVQIAGLEDIAQELLLRGFCVPPVALEGRLVRDVHQDLPSRGVGLPHGIAGGLAHDVAGVGVDGHGHEGVAQQESQQQPVVADTARGIRPAVVIQQAKHALTAAKELQHARHAKPLPEAFPDVGPQSVPLHAAHPVLPVQGGRRRRQQVANGLAHVDEGRGAGVADVRPEGARTEPLAQSHGDTHAEVGDLDDARRAVVQRHAAVPALVGLGADATLIGPREHSVHGEGRALGHARRARRVQQHARELAVHVVGVPAVVGQHAVGEAVQRHLVDSHDLEAQLPFQHGAAVLDASHAVRVVVDQQHLGATQSQTVLQGVPSQVVVHRRRCASQCPQRQPRKQELGPVVQIERHQLSPPHAQRVEVVRILDGLGQGLCVRILGVARPDTAFLRILQRTLVEVEPEVPLALGRCVSQLSTLVSCS